MNKKIYVNCCNIIFSIDFIEPLAGKQFYSLCSSLNTLLLDFYMLYDFQYEKHDWIFLMKGKNNICDENTNIAINFVVESFTKFSNILKDLRKDVWDKIRIEKSIQMHESGYNKQVKLVKRLVQQNPLFIHTSLKICNRMKKQRLKLCMMKRAKIKCNINDVYDLFFALVKKLSNQQ